MAEETQHRSAVEARFAEVFAHLGLLSAYARRRGARDPDAIAAEAMAIAWRRLADVPRDDPRPWLIATARNAARRPAAPRDAFARSRWCRPRGATGASEPGPRARSRAGSRARDAVLDRPRGPTACGLGGPHAGRRGGQPRHLAGGLPSATAPRPAPSPPRAWRPREAPSTRELRTQPGAAMSTDRLLERVRGRPGPARDVADDALFARIVGGPGDPRLANPRRRAPAGVAMGTRGWP